jgi:hypothetical protein
MAQSLPRFDVSIDVADLPEQWQVGYANCVPNEKDFDPGDEGGLFPALEVMAHWFDLGMAQDLTVGPVPSVEGERYFAFSFKVLSFTTLREPQWRSRSSQAFKCANYDEAKAVTERLGLIHHHLRWR